MLFWALLALASSTIAVPANHIKRTPTRSYPQDSLEKRVEVQAARASEVVYTFQIAWNGYYKFAFPNDELEPVTNSFQNPRNGWAGSAIDGLDTAIIMGLDSVVSDILDYVPNINYAQSYQDESVDLFETTIRYIGGMLSAYDLLAGPFSHMTMNMTSQVQSLLNQSVNLANELKFAFDTPTGIPYNDVYINNNSIADSSPINGLATIGSLVLEWTHLSDLTGDPSYAALTQKGESYLLNPQPSWAEPFPGLVGTNVNITNGEFLDAEGGWDGGDDSFYEYLIKMYVYDSSRFGEYKDRWILAADSTIANLTSHPVTLPNITYVDAYENATLIETSEELACFDGGNFILGGIVLGEQQYIDYGLALVEGCHNTYASDTTGIGPEVFSWDPSAVPAGQEQFFQEHGFYVTDGDYVLRPEYLESLYYAYRVTGNETYQDWSWEAFLAINSTTYVGSGYSDIADVTVAGGGAFQNVQETYFFAEVLKYAYLIQAPDGPWQVYYQGNNEYVFNTEAHPFKVAGQALP